MPERHKVRLERWGVALMGVGAYLLALDADGVYDLVKDASSFGSAGIFVVFVLGLFTKIGGWRSAVASLTVGVLVWLAGHYVFEFDFSYLLALATSFVAYVFVAIFEPLASRSALAEVEM